MYMACFLISAAEAAVVTIATKVAEKKGSAHPENSEKQTHQAQQTHEEARIPFTHKLKWLSHMLWGGSALLAFEHVWHGEVVSWFPFLTAMNNPADMTEMLAEMGSVGVVMAALITAVWGGMVLITNSLEKAAEKTALQSDPATR